MASGMKSEIKELQPADAASGQQSTTKGKKRREKVQCGSIFNGFRARVSLV